MPRRFTWIYSAIVLLTASAPLHAVTFVVGGCKTGSGYKNFTTIQAAVSAVGYGGTIFVCPGTYPETVYINTALTLQGIGSGNSNRAVITINPNGFLAPNITSSITGEQLYAQVLVTAPQPAGPVNIIGITVDGAGGTQGCASGSGLVGIFYASGTSGTVNGVTTRNHQSCGLGNGIWAENAAGQPSESVTIENSSVHDADQAGITAATDAVTSTLSVTAHGNSIYVPTIAGISADGMILDAVGANVNQNVITGGDDVGIYHMGTRSPTAPAVTITSNTIADVSTGRLGDGMLLGATGATVEHNVIANVFTGFDIPNSANPLIQSNTTLNTGRAVEFRCTGSASITKNIFNDSQIAFHDTPSAIPGNPLYSIDTIWSNTCP